MITQKQREERKGYIGGSDVAAIMGVSSYAKPYDIWLEKVGKLEDKKVETEAMSLGTLLESSVIKWAAQELGPIEKRSRCLELRSDSLPIVTHPDGIVKADNSPVEAKTSGLLGPLLGAWGEAGTDQIPDEYVVQATAHLMCAKSDVCHVPCLLGGRGMVMYRVKRNQDLIDLITEKVSLFWALVQSNTPPAGWPSLEVAKYIRRTEGKRKAISIDPVQTWRDLDAKAKEAVKAADDAKAQVLTIMDDAEIGEVEGGIVKATKSKQKRIDADLLREKYPEIAAEVTKESESTRIAWKGNKV